MSERSEARGQLIIFSSNLFFGIMAVLVKLISEQVGGIFISLFRFVIGTVLVTGFLITTKKGFKIRRFRDWIMRGLLGALAMILYFLAIQITSSGRATLLSNTFPVFVALFGFLFFKEQISVRNIISVLICAAGVFFVFYDESSYSMLGDILSILSSVMAGMAVHFLKRAREKNNSYIVYLSPCLFGLTVTSISAPAVLQIDIGLLTILIIIGVLAFAAQMTLTYGIKFVSPTKASTITFAKIPVAILLSLFIGEEFRLRFIIGTIMILAGLLINRKT